MISRGSVYVFDDIVLRKISVEHTENVIEVLKVVNSCIDGIIETAVCDLNIIAPPEIKNKGYIVNFKT